jgi:hypothetical protein
MPPFVADREIERFRIHPDEDPKVVIHVQSEKGQRPMHCSTSGNQFHLPIENAPCDSDHFGLGLVGVHRASEVTS